MTFHAHAHLPELMGQLGDFVAANEPQALPPPEQAAKLAQLAKQQGGLGEIGAKEKGEGPRRRRQPATIQT